MVSDLFNCLFIVVIYALARKLSIVLIYSVFVISMIYCHLFLRYFN